MTFWVVMIVFGTALVGGLAAMFFVTATAPLGYQDETGFHYGDPAPQKQENARTPTLEVGLAEGAFAVTMLKDFARQGTGVSGAC